MSDFGILVYNAHGDATISTLRPQYCLYDSGSWTGSGAGTDEGVDAITFASSTTLLPIIGLKFPEDAADNVLANVKGLILSGGSYTGFNLAHMSTNPHETIYWAAYVQVQNSDAVSGTYGINLYDADGDLTWSTAVNMMRLCKPPFAGAGSPPWDYPCDDAYGSYFLCQPWRGGYDNALGAWMDLMTSDPADGQNIIIQPAYFNSADTGKSGEIDSPSCPYLYEIRLMV